MPLTLVNPMNETPAQAIAPPSRLTTLAGKRIALLDISKGGGSFFLDRLEKIFRDRYQVAEVTRAKKPTFTKNAPEQIIEQLRSADAVVEGLAD
jgi:hypothetical protein